MNSVFKFVPVILDAQAAEQEGHLEAQALYLHCHRSRGAFIGGMQRIMTLRPGEAGVLLEGEEVDEVELKRWLAEGYDLLLLDGGVDATSGDMIVDDVTLVIADCARCAKAQAMLVQANPVVLQRFRQLAIQAVQC
jgi:hypothetical protein